MDTPSHNGAKWVEEQLEEFCSHIETFCQLQSVLNQDSSFLDN
jgi:mannose-1-phosphate guanylyltransferase/phosphomannomutase